ncbi:MAG TPA: hypothetical protein VGR49_00845 [Actinomycetota bacterium]|jgi:hypothetical protein|nr:hypothetical protein [Actinomycetota bacterium]
MKIGEAEREFLVAEALALADQLGQEGSLAYREIARTATEGEIPDEWEERVGELLALSVETGRVRAVHGPAGVRALLALWKDTPQGKKVAEELDELNLALSALRGLPLEAFRVAAIGPGNHLVTVAAGDYELRLSIDRNGVRLRSLNVGGGGIGE